MTNTLPFESEEALTSFKISEQRTCVDIVNRILMNIIKDVDYPQSDSQLNFKALKFIQFGLEHAKLSTKELKQSALIGTNDLLTKHQLEGPLEEGFVAHIISSFFSGRLAHVIMRIQQDIQQGVIKLENSEEDYLAECLNRISHFTYYIIKILVNHERINVIDPKVNLEKHLSQFEIDLASACARVIFNIKAFYFSLLQQTHEN